MTRDNRNRGTISKNTRKTEDNHPDIAGQINVDGRDYWLNGWLKKNGNDGSSFYSLTVKPKQVGAGSNVRHDRDDPRTHRQPDDRAGDDRDIPF